MAKVTKKLQVTIPRELAERCRIQPGDEIEWSTATDGLRIKSARMQPSSMSVASRLALFDASTQRQDSRQSRMTLRIADRVADGGGRGWKRQDLYTRGRTR